VSFRTSAAIASRAAAAAMLGCAALCMTLMEERPLAGPAMPVEMAE